MEKILSEMYTERNIREDDKMGSHGAFSIERGLLFSGWIGKNKEVLDLGCCNGSLTLSYLEGNKVTGYDVDSESLALCDKKITVEQHDLNGNWQEGTESKFDVVVSSEVVEHLFHPDRVFEKVVFVLKKDGEFIGSVPNAFNLKNRVRLFFAQKKATPLGEPTHINHFSYDELNALLLKYFEEVEIVPLVQKKWQWFAKLFPGLGSFLLAFRAQKPKKI